ncbi:MAG: CRISPR-associated endonuclease Cas2 [Patescibacteria group bacterium]
MLLVSYDITSNKTRSQFSKFLKKFGRRIQYSVFELKNSQRILQNILKEVEYKYKNRFANTDSVIIFNICNGCKKKISRCGYAANEEKEVVFF